MKKSFVFYSFYKKKTFNYLIFKFPQMTGFMLASGIGQNISQSHALLNYQFSSLGGSSLGSMLLGYRYHSGYGVEADCEAALVNYKHAAEKGL